MSFSGQIVYEIIDQLCLENSIQTLLNFFGLSKKKYIRGVCMEFSEYKRLTSHIVLSECLDKSRNFRNFICMTSSLQYSIEQFFFTNYTIFFKLCDQMQFQANCVKSHHCVHVLSERPWLQNQCISLSHSNSVYLHQFNTINPVQNHQIKVIIMNQTYSVRW